MTTYKTTQSNQQEASSARSAQEMTTLEAWCQQQRGRENHLRLTRRRRSIRTIRTAIRYKRSKPIQTPTPTTMKPTLGSTQSTWNLVYVWLNGSMATNTTQKTSPKLKKWLYTLVLGAVCFVVALGSAIVTGDMERPAEYFGVSKK